MKIFLLLLFICTQLISQVFSGFGRNKIQYNNFEWNILKTEHFDIYYYDEMETLAKQGAFFAEESYRLIEKDFNHTVKRRIPLIFYSTHIHFQETNITPGFIPEGVGGFFEFLKGRVVIPGNGNINQFKKVIRHELVHVFMHSKVSWVNKQHGRFGGLMPPLWFVEGLADYYSAEWSADGEMIMKDAVLYNRLPRLNQMWRIHGTYTMYKIGENILHYIADNFGEEKIQQFMDNIWKGKKFEQVFLYTMGMNYKTFSDKWHYAMKKKYYPMLKDYDFADAVTTSVESKGFNFKPLYDSEKKEVLFWSNRTGYTGIFKRPLKKINLGLEDEKEEQDTEVIFLGEQNGDFESFHVFHSKFDLNKKRELIFSSKTQGADALYIYNLEKEDIVNKITFPDLVSMLSPSWSSDQKTVCFVGLKKSGFKDIYTYNIETKERKQLTDDFYEDNDPSWSNDGRYIVFSSDRTEKGNQWAYNIFRLNVETGKTDYLTYGKKKDSSPVYSPNGKYIAYVSTENLEKNIYLISTDSKDHKKIKLTNYISTVFDLDWVNDDELVFSVFAGGRFKLQHLKGIEKKWAGKADLFAENHSFPSQKEKTWEIPDLAKVEKVSIENYESDYAIDFAQSQVSQDPVFGTTGGAILGISDVLGNDRYTLLVYNNAQTSTSLLKSFNFRAAKYSLGQRVNYGYGIFRFTGTRYDLKRYYEEDEIGGDFVLEYPFDQFRRLNFYTNLRYSERTEFIDTDYSWLSTANVSYVKDNSIWGATGPVDGERFKVSFGYTEDFVNSNIGFTTFLADYRKYFRVTKRTNYAIRAMFLQNNGKGSRYYALGGSWDLRGYKFLALRGEKLFLLSQEYRFPLMDFFGFKFSFGPALGSNLIRGALFVDIGNAYDHKIDFSDYRGSYGAGIRMRMFGALILRYDVGRRMKYRTNSNFTQFFFGWDF